MRRSRRGVTIVYAVVILGAMLGIVSLAVDFARVQVIKNEMHCCADATAIAGVDAYADNGYSYSAGFSSASSIYTANLADKSSGVMPTVTMVGGTWDATTHTFSTTYAPGTPAASITISRTAAAGNAVPLYFGKLIGMPTCNVQASAIATLIDSAAGGVTVPATGNPYLAGMPAGSSTTRGDTTSNAPAYQQTVINVVPGTWITLTAPSGTTSIVPGVTGYFGPEGESTRPLHHGQNYDGSDYGIGPENGIGDAVLPATALYGVFLDDNAPTATAAPATVDWTQPGMADQASYNNLTLKSPFLIGDGKTSGGVVQRFQVPPGATRLYLGVWDGVTQSNNAGSISATLNLTRTVRLVK